MKNRILFIFFISIVQFITAQKPFNYKEEIEQWKIGRYAALKESNGWLNLAGLFWLEQGKSNFGSDKKNKIVFPKGSIAANAGYIELEGNTVRITAAKGVSIKVNNQLIQSSIIFSPDSLKNPVVSAGSLHWTIIKREDKIGIRLRDDNSAQLKQFKGIDRFPTDSTWKLDAILKEPLFATTIPIKNVLGQTIQMKLLGKLIFTIKGQIYSLDAVEEGANLFVIFADATNAKTTYGAGRFLYAPKPDATGKTVVDFNKAFNPPCAFTPFATCPLPPPQNVLSIPITAGELNYGKH
ncbi:MAG: DUF1684 domain-containing protein [Sediminibacterium sp.]|nr:DUF1684 domain-containing protein [Sediminibacterium sp.]